MKQLYEHMVKTLTGSNRSGAWSQFNKKQELLSVIDNWKTLTWGDKFTVGYRDLLVNRFSEMFSVDPEVMRGWIYDPDFKCYQDNASDARMLDDNEQLTRECIAGTLNLDASSVNIRLHLQKPGEMTSCHIDSPKHELYELAAEQEHLIEKYAIFLDDQHDGQVWQTNSTFVKCAREMCYILKTLHLTVLQTLDITIVL